MTLKDVREWLKPQITDASFHIGKIDASKEKVIGIYSRPSSADSIAIGGLNNTSAATKFISILVHWNKNCDTSEQIAKSIYELFNAQVAVINGINAFFIMKNDEPVCIGADDKDIFEFVIDIEIKYKRG